MPFQLIDEDRVFQGKIFDLVRARVALPDGKEHIYDLIRHHGAVTIVPVDAQGRIWLVRQFRVGAEKSLLELPAGLLEENETPETSAMREIQEEIGMAAEKLTRLGDFYMVPGYSTEKLTAFLATGLYPSVLPADDDEYLERVAMPAAEVFEMAQSGQLQDGKTLAALLMAQPHLK